MTSTEAATALRSALTALEDGDYHEAVRLAKHAKSLINRSISDAKNAAAHTAAHERALQRRAQAPEPTG